RKMRKFDLSLRSSRSSYFATFRHQLTILSKTDALDEEKWLNMLGTFVKDWFRYESHFVHGRDSLVDILKERGLLSESDAVQPLIGKKSHTLGASLNIRHNLSSSKGPKPLQLKLLTTYIPKTSAFTLAFSTSQRLRTTRASARTFFTFRHYITPSARNF